jgi:hypothetical protein
MTTDQDLLRYLFRNSGFGPKLRSEILPNLEMPEIDWDGKIVLSSGLTISSPGQKCITKGILDKKIKDIISYLYPQVTTDTKSFIKRMDHVRIINGETEQWTNNKTTNGSNYRLSENIIVCPRYTVDSKFLLVFYNDLLAIWGNASTGTYMELGESGSSSELIQIHVTPKVGDRVSCIVYDVDEGRINVGPIICSDGKVVYDKKECDNGYIDCSLLENKDLPECQCEECPPPCDDCPGPSQPPPVEPCEVILEIEIIETGGGGFFILNKNTGNYTFIGNNDDDGNMPSIRVRPGQAKFATASFPSTGVVTDYGLQQVWGHNMGKGKTPTDRAVRTMVPYFIPMPAYKSTVFQTVLLPDDLLSEEEKLIDISQRQRFIKFTNSSCMAQPGQIRWTMYPELMVDGKGYEWDPYNNLVSYTQYPKQSIPSVYVAYSSTQRRSKYDMIIKETSYWTGATYDVAVVIGEEWAKIMFTESRGNHLRDISVGGQVEWGSISRGGTYGQKSTPTDDGEILQNLDNEQIWIEIPKSYVEGDIIKIYNCANSNPYPYEGLQVHGELEIDESAGLTARGILVIDMKNDAIVYYPTGGSKDKSTKFTLIDQETGQVMNSWVDSEQPNTKTWEPEFPTADSEENAMILKPTFTMPRREWDVTPTWSVESLREEDDDTENPNQTQFLYMYNGTGQTGMVNGSGSQYSWSSTVDSLTAPVLEMDGIVALNQTDRRVMRKRTETHAGQQMDLLAGIEYSQIYCDIYYKFFDDLNQFDEIHLFITDKNGKKINPTVYDTENLVFMYDILTDVFEDKKTFVTIYTVTK